LSSSATPSTCASVTAAKSVAVGKCCRSRPLVFSSEPRCQGACGSQKKTFAVGVDADLLPVAHLGTLVPGQRAAQRLRQGLRVAREARCLPCSGSAAPRCFGVRVDCGDVLLGCPCGG
jgi:hypothetical protein